MSDREKMGGLKLLNVSGRRRAGRRGQRDPNHPLQPLERTRIAIGLVKVKDSGQGGQVRFGSVLRVYPGAKVLPHLGDYVKWDIGDLGQLFVVLTPAKEGVKGAIKVRHDKNRGQRRNYIDMSLPEDLKAEYNDYFHGLNLVGEKKDGSSFLIPLAPSIKIRATEPSDEDAEPEE